MTTLPVSERLRHIYRLWPRYRPGSVELGGAGWRMFVVTAAGVSAIAALLCVPSVTRATGLPAPWVVGLCVVYLGLMAFNDAVLNPAASRSRRAFDVQLVVVPLYNLAICASLVVLPNEPRSPLWMALLVYACATGGWQEIDASVAFLVMHTVWPLATIPIFLERGADPAWSVAGPSLCALMSGLAYHVLAVNGATWRRLRAEQAATIERLRARAAELERGRIARELHDSVGSALGLAALYGDLIERRAHEPEELRRIAAELRGSAREGLGEMRGLLDALAPPAEDAKALADNLSRLGRRAAQAGSADVVVSLVGDGAVAIDGPRRLALVRVFQEALHNALRHGQAARIAAALLIDEAGLTLRVADDGRGFDEGEVEPGRGLVGMRARAAELGGEVTVRSAHGQGTTVVLRVPWATEGGATR